MLLAARTYGKRVTAHQVIALPEHSYSSFVLYLVWCRGAGELRSVGLAAVERTLAAEIIKTVEPKALQALHSVYVAIHRAHRNAPELFTLAHCTTIITGLMSAQKWSWRVVGITLGALRHYQSRNFRHSSKQGITRAHLRPRRETIKELLLPEKPLSEGDFIETLLRNDRTVICSSGENRDVVSDYIEFDNTDASLFSSRRIAWTHGRKEREFLEALAREHLPKELRAVNAKNERISTRVGASVRRKGGEVAEFERSDRKYTGETLAAVRATRHAVSVLGKRYSSLWQAWKALKLPASHSQAFRKRLKETGRLSYTYGGQTFEFHIVE